MTPGVWVDGWQLPRDTLAFAAKRARRRLSRSDLGSEEYLVSVTDTSAAARRRVSIYQEA